MSSLAEIEAAVVALPHEEKVQLLTFLSNHVAPQSRAGDQPRYHDSSNYPPINSGADLSLKESEIPESFRRAMAQAAAGQLVDMETALTATPPSRAS
jgi:hypothetical protein